MIIYELLSFNKELLQKLYDCGINTVDFKYVEVYNEYLRLKKDNLKKAYIVSLLSEVYSMSERNVYNVLSKMEKMI